MSRSKELERQSRSYEGRLSRIVLVLVVDKVRASRTNVTNQGGFAKIKFVGNSKTLGENTRLEDEDDDENEDD